MPRCAVVNCHCGYDGFPTPKDIRWFYVPKSQTQRDQWEFRMGRQDFRITKYTQICSVHFKGEDYIPESENKDSSGRKRKKSKLKSSALPSLHMGKCKCAIHHKPERSSQSKPLSDDDNSAFNNSLDKLQESPLKKFKKYIEPPTSSKYNEIEAEEVSWPFSHPQVAGEVLGQMSNSMEVINPIIQGGQPSGYNPWQVSDASRFLRYCCPECDFRNEDLQEFSEHALENHIFANTLFGPEKDNIKLEPSHDSTRSDMVQNTVDVKSTDFEQLEDISENKENFDSDPLSCDYQIHNQEIHALSSPHHDHESHAQKGHTQEGHTQKGHAQKGHTQKGHTQKGHTQKGHAQESNDNNNFVQCNICDQIVNKVELLQHLKASHKDNDRLNDIFLSSEKVLESLKARNVFSLVDSELFHCKFCSHTTISSRDLFSHHQENHTIKDWQIFQCESCNYHTKGKKKILDHMKNEHDIDDYKPYKCHNCDYNTPEFIKPSSGSLKQAQG